MTTNNPSADNSASQYRLRDLLAIMAGVSVLLGAGRLFGGSIGRGEAALLVVSLVSISVATVFLRQRWLWYIALAAAFMLPLALTPGDPLSRVAISSLAAAHFFFAGLPVVMVDPRQRRWPWAALAAACQTGAAAMTPPDVFSLLLFAAPLSWLLALAAIGWRYRVTVRRSHPLVQPEKTVAK